MDKPWSELAEAGRSWSSSLELMGLKMDWRRLKVRLLFENRESCVSPHPKWVPHLSCQLGAAPHWPFLGGASHHHQQGKGVLPGHLGDLQSRTSTATCSTTNSYCQAQKQPCRYSAALLARRALINPLRPLNFERLTWSVEAPSLPRSIQANLKPPI